MNKRNSLSPQDVLLQTDEVILMMFINARDALNEAIGNLAGQIKHRQGHPQPHEAPGLLARISDLEQQITQLRPVFEAARKLVGLREGCRYQDVVERLQNLQTTRPPTTTSALYTLMVAYLRRSGWQREQDSGWWWRENQRDTLPMGQAVDEQLIADGIDLRTEPG